MSAQRLTDLLALSHVPRWSIVDHLKPQTVSDHVYRVMVIATELARRLGIRIEERTLSYILVHDAAECRTGDIPTPAKKHLQGLDETERLFCSWLNLERPLEQADLFTLADLIEATTFIQRYGIGQHAGRVYMDLCRSVNDKCPVGWLPHIRELMQEISEDKGR